MNKIFKKTMLFVLIGVSTLCASNLTCMESTSDDKGFKWLSTESSNYLCQVRPDIRRPVGSSLGYAVGYNLVIKNKETSEEKFVQIIYKGITMPHLGCEPIIQFFSLCGKFCGVYFNDIAYNKNRLYSAETNSFYGFEHSNLLQRGS